MSLPSDKSCPGATNPIKTAILFPEWTSGLIVVLCPLREQSLTNEQYQDVVQLCHNLRS